MGCRLPVREVLPDYLTPLSRVSDAKLGSHVSDTLSTSTCVDCVYAGKIYMYTLPLFGCIARGLLFT